MWSMVYAVSEGKLPRQEVVDFFGTLFTGTEADPGSQFWSLLANASYDLYPAGLMPVLQEAYHRKLISTGVIGYRDLEKVLQRDQTAVLAQFRSKWRRKSLKQAIITLARTGTLQHVIGIPSLRDVVAAIKLLFKPPPPPP